MTATVMVNAARGRRVARASLLVVFACPVLLLLTNYWTGLASYTHPWGTDVVSYQELATAAPGLPHILMGSAYTQRFAPHYLVGLISWAAGIGIHPAYRTVWALCFLGVIGVSAKTLLSMRLSTIVFALSFALFLFDPYSLRESILTPGAVQDLTFVLGLGLVMWGLLDDMFAVVLVGSVVAILSRQTELLVAPVAAYWVLCGPTWREQTVRVRRTRAALILVLTTVLYVAMDLVTSSFTKRFEPSFPHDTILSLLSPSHAHISTLASHLGRCAIPLIMPTAVILAALVASRLRGRPGERLPFEFYASLAIGVAVIVQPIVVSPSFPGFSHNEQRLVGIGLLPIALAAAVALREGQLRGALELSRPALGIALVGMAVGSLHHIFTRIGPPNLGAFVALQVLAATLAFLALVAPVRFFIRGGVLVGGLLAILLCGPLGSVARAEPMWTTYHRDAQRSGYDPDATQPIEPAFAWQTVNLEAPIWSQPLVLGDRVYVATVGDELYTLEASTGNVVWKKSLGVPVPAAELPCGDIEPTVGVVGTPVIDPTTQTIYAVADTWNASTKEVHHILEGLSLSSGEEVLSTPVDPPGADPKAILQRTALNLDNGEIIFGFGGNDGDCSNYRGTVVAVPENGEGARFWQYRPAPPSISGGAVWATSGPAVDEAGNVYATTGNPNPPAGQSATVFDYSDSVVELNPTQDFLANPATEVAAPLGWFAPPNWEEESNNDLDLSSAGAELLPGGLLFQAGKDGTGYLIDEATLSSGAPAVFSEEVCAGAGSFGGDAFANGVIYIPCANGTQALSYDEQACTFTPLWRGPSDAFGPPIVSAGLVWSVATGKFSGGGVALYGLDPSTGVPRYTETLPSPVADHFASPSAAGGRLLVATGSTVTAYQIAQLSAGVPSTPAAPSTAGCVPKGGSPEPPQGNTKAPQTITGTTTSITSKPASPATASPPPPVLLLHARLHATRDGRLRVALGCPAAAGVCQGVVRLRATFLVRDDGSRRLHSHHFVSIVLAHGRFGPARGDFAITLHLSASARAHLRRHHDRVALQVLLSGPGSPTRSVKAVLRLASA